MAMRGFRERAVQSLLLEAGAILVVAPLCSLATGVPLGDSVGLLVALALVVLAFSPLYCWLFDLAEGRLTGRPATERPQGMRAVHALGHEVGSMVVTVPIILWFTGLDLGAAVTLDIGLTLAYVAWVWLFFWAYDRARPLPAL